MFYFAYDWRMEWRWVERWGAAPGRLMPLPRRVLPGVVRNHRLGFGGYDARWGGGVATLDREAGKSVAGALFDVTPGTLAVFERLARSTAVEAGTPRRVELGVIELGVIELARGDCVSAVTHVFDHEPRLSTPPSELMLRVMVGRAYGLGLSEMWIAHLRSFETQAMAV